MHRLPLLFRAPPLRLPLCCCCRDGVVHGKSSVLHLRRKASQCHRGKRDATRKSSPTSSHPSLPLIFSPLSLKKNQPLAADDASLLRARVAALEAELRGMRLSSMLMSATASASAAAQPPLSSPTLLPTTTTPAAVAAADPASASASAASAASHDDDDQPTALVPRAALELLKLKDQAMDSVLEGITIADARRPDMPLIYVRALFFSLPFFFFSLLRFSSSSFFFFFPFFG